MWRICEQCGTVIPGEENPLFSTPPGYGSCGKCGTYTPTYEQKLSSICIEAAFQEVIVIDQKLHGRAYQEEVARTMMQRTGMSFEEVAEQARIRQIDRESF